MRVTSPNEADSVKTLKGIDQQDFKELQLVSGYPNLIGLQQRLPGKATQRKVDGAVGSIYVFYLVFGRAYLLTDYGTISITPITPDPITIPVLPPILLKMFEMFDEYTDLSINTFILPEGIWAGGPGVCQSRVLGYIDPFKGTPYESTFPIPPPGGGDGGLGGGTVGDTVPPSPPFPPDPPPGSTVPQFPEDCATMPGIPFQDFSLSGIVTVLDRLSGSNNFSADSPGAGPPLGPYLIVNAFSSVATAGLSGSKSLENQNAFQLSSPTHYEYINFAVETRTLASFALPDLPLDAVAYLVGTKTETDGTLTGTTPNNVTTCACLRIGRGGTVSGTITIGGPVGAEWNFVDLVTGGTSKGQSGDVGYTFIRVFSNSF